MMPIIRPLSMPHTPVTEYQKERAAFAEMKVALRRRKRRLLLLRVFRRAKPLFRISLSVNVGRSPDHRTTGGVRTARAPNV
ncbi:hypothetical protein AL073_12985 [Loktanella sp. 1ANDIMAR09]|nr:hypothetical protein AL073_12985 [Loktanella sp. 1ANDIMAR09]